MSQKQRSPPWSDLPLELLSLVMLRLPTRADRAFFPAVCRMWCSAVRQCHLPLPSPVPWLVLSSGSATCFPSGETLQLPDDVYYKASCDEWLLLSRDDGSCFLMNPFTKATMPLPSLCSYNYCKEPVDVVGDYMVPDIGILGTWKDIKDASEISVVSLVVCSRHLIAAIVAVRGYCSIAMCRIGAATWSVSAYDQCRQLSNMVFFEGKLYALDNKDLIAIDIVDEDDSKGPRVSRIECLIACISLPIQKYSIWMEHYYLLESHGSLLMISRKDSYKSDNSILVAEGSKFKVFKANFEQHLWAEVRTLGNDQALFIGPRCSRAVRLSPYDLSGDCIVFLGDHIDRAWDKTARVYDMKDEKIYSPLPVVSWRCELLATWIFSQGVTDEAASARTEEPN